MRCAAICLVFFALSQSAAGKVDYPSPQSAWEASHYVDFYFMHRQGNQALPHLRSEEGQRLLARLTDRGNIERILSAELPAAEKRRLLGLVAMSMGGVRGAYAVSELAGEPLAEELVRVQAFQLYVIARNIELGGEALPVSAWQTSLLGVMRSLTEGQRCSEAQRVLLASAILDDYPAFMRILEDGQKAVLSDLAAKLGGGAHSVELRRVMGRLVQTVEESRVQ
jgi:hypothetical protein